MARISVTLVAQFSNREISGVLSASQRSLENPNHSVKTADRFWSIHVASIVRDADRTISNPGTE